MISFKNKRKKFFLSKFLIGVFISVLSLVLSCAITVQGISPDISGQPLLPDGISGFYAGSYWISNMYIQENATGPTFHEVVPLWGNSSDDFYVNVGQDSLSSVNTAELYDSLGKYRTLTYNDASRTTSYYLATVSMKVIFTNTLTIPAGMQCEFWVRVNKLTISGIGVDAVSGTTDVNYSYNTNYFNNIFDDRWIESQHDEPYVIWDNITPLTANDWICFRSDTSTSDRTISGICLLAPPGTAKKVYGSTSHNLTVEMDFDFSPILIGDLENYTSIPPETEPPVVTPDDPQLDEIINGSPDMDPDVSTPNYGDIEPDSDYNVGGLVGEDHAISNLENMQGAANDLVGSFGFVQASNFWQDVFAKIFNLAGASVMASISGAIIVIRAVIGR